MGLLKPTPADCQAEVDWLLSQRRFSEVLDMFEAWERSGFEWWTLFQDRLSSIPHDLLRSRTRILLRGVMPLAWAQQRKRAFETLALAEKGLDPRDAAGRALVRLSRGELCTEIGRYDEAQQAFDGLDLILDEPRQLLRLLNCQAVICNDTVFDLAEMERLLLKHNRIAMEIADHRAASVSAHNLCQNVYVPSGRFDKADAFADDLLRPEVDSPFSRMMGLVCKALIAYDLGQGDVEKALREAAEAADGVGIGVKSQQMNSMLAELLARQGRFEEAQPLVAKYIVPIEEGRQPDELLHCAAARLALWQGDEAEAERQTRASTENPKTPERLARSLLEVASLLGGLGKEEQAAGLARQALSIGERYGLEYLKARALLAVFAFCEEDRLPNLRTLLRICREHGYESLLLNREPEPALTALTMAASLDVEATYARSLLARMAHPAVEVRILGSLRVKVGFRSVAESDWGRAKARALFVFLLLRHRRPVPVDLILDALFRDQPEHSAKNGLRVAATMLRDALEPERVARGRSSYLSSDGKIMCLHLGASAWVDVEEFRRQSHRARRNDRTLDERLEASRVALSLVQQPVLAEFYGEEWFLQELEAIEQELRSVRVQCGMDLLEAGEWLEAEEQARALRAADPLDESALEIEVRALVNRGAQSEALKVLRRFERCCDAELGPGEPPAAVRRLRASVDG
jgi:DNA-binding SARP family transcriptional activator/tetratricopeptide (TPR) repeat protein